MPQAQGTRAYLAIQREPAYKTDPASYATKKVPFVTETLNRTIALESSDTLRGVRTAVAPIRGNTEVGGGINFNLGAYPGELFTALLGSVKTTLIGTGETLGTAVTVTTATIDAAAQTMLVNASGHGLALGDMINIATLTAPTALNATYCPIIAKTTDTFTLAIPVGVSGSVTIGSGTFKKVTVAGTAYQHVFQVGKVLPSWQVEKGFPDVAQYFLFKGLVGGKLSLAATAAGFQKASIDFLGADSAAATTAVATPAETTVREFDGFGISLLEEGGSGITTITEVGLNIDNGLDGNTFVIGGAGIRGAVNPGITKVTASIKGLFVDRALHTKGVNQTETSLKLTYAKGTGAGTSGNEALEFFLPEMLLSAADPPVDGPRGVFISVNAEGYFDNSAEGTSLQITLKTPTLSVWG